MKIQAPSSLVNWIRHKKAPVDYAVVILAIEWSYSGKL
jgi:hypothetical protein